MSLRTGFEPGRLPILGAALIALALILSGCVEERTFAHQARTPETRKLVVPNKITPPVMVARIKGAPDHWKMNERLAEALRDRDIPAGTRGRSKASYTVRGRAEPLTAKSGEISQVRIYWQLLDANGKRVGVVVQQSAVPPKVWSKPDKRTLNRLAQAAAESLSPLVPSSALKGKQLAVSGAPIRRRDPTSRKPVTAIGKQDAKRGARGLSGRLLALRNVRKLRQQTPEQRLAMKRRAASAGAAGAPSTTSDVPEKKGDKGAGKTPQQVGVAPSDVMEKPIAGGGGDKITKRTVITERLAALVRGVLGARGVRGGGRAQVAVRPEARPRLRQVQRVAGSRMVRPDPTAKSLQIGPDPDRGKVGIKRPRWSGAANARARRGGGARVAARPVQNTKGFWVQLASNPNPKASRSAWTALVTAHGRLIAGQPHAVNAANLGRRGVYYRLQLGPYASAGEAGRVCASLRRAKVECFLVAPRGQIAVRTPVLKRRATPPKAPTSPPKAKVGVPKAKTPPKAKTAVPPKAKTPPKPRRAATPRRAPDAAAKRAAGVKPAAGPRRVKSKTAKTKTGEAKRAAARTPKRAGELPFQRSKTVPGLTD